MNSTPSAPPARIDVPLADLPAEGDVFSTSWKLATGDMDARQYLRLDGVARYIQEVGAEHIVDANAQDVHPYWIVRRALVDVIEPLTWPNEVTFHRWCSAVGSRSCTMRVRLQGANGGRIETEGFWTNLDKDTLTPSPITDGFFNRLATTTEEHQLKWHQWLPDPVPEGSASFSFPLRHTDIDLFQHLNNTNYWHAVHEVLARYPKIGTAPYRAVVEYRRPITHDEPVTIRHCLSDASVRFWFCVGDEVRAAAMAATLTR